MTGNLSFEDPETTFFITSKTIGSKLWFVNNPTLHSRIAAYLAKYQQKYGVILHAFIIMGNHIHLVARFPNSNKKIFMQALNSTIVSLVKKYVPNYYKGKLWARPPRYQPLPENADIMHWTLYTGLNPVRSGLTPKYTQYKTFNSLSPAIAGKKLKYEVVDWTAYHNARRANERTPIENYTSEYELVFSRPPGFEHLSQHEYSKIMDERVEKRRCEMIEELRSEGRGFAGPEVLQNIEPGDSPQSTKSSERYSKRPLVLTLNPEARKIYTDRYLRLLEAYREASARFRNGDLNAVFPPGTYRPPLFCSG